MLLQGWESVLLAGHSYGGPLVLRVAAEQPKLVAGVITLGIGYPESPEPAEGCRTMRCAALDTVSCREKKLLSRVVCERESAAAACSRAALALATLS